MIRHGFGSPHELHQLPGWLSSYLLLQEQLICLKEGRTDNKGRQLNRYIFFKAVFRSQNLSWKKKVEMKYGIVGLI